MDQLTGPEKLVQKAYVAYYGRHADPEGLQYWSDRVADAGSLDAIIQAFGDSQEFTQRFGNFTAEQLVTNLFQQMFNRDPDVAGLDFYTERLASGESSLQSIAIEVLFGASGDDADVLANKVAAANAFTDTLGRAGALAPNLEATDQSEMLQRVDATEASVARAVQQHDRHFLTDAGTVNNTYTVDTTADTVDGECQNDCSLRDALLAANASPGLDKIVLGDGTYTLSRQGDDSTRADFGDLVVKDDLIIEGAGRDSTLIDPGGLYRALQIEGGGEGVDVKVSGLTLQNGRQDFGGAIANAGELLLQDVRLTGNVSDNGGAATNSGRLVVYDSVLEGNSASQDNADTGFGGAVWNNENSSLFISNSDVRTNTADQNGGGVFGFGDVHVLDSTFAQNQSGATGGAIDASGTLHVSQGVFAENSANDGGAVAVRGGSGEITETAFTANRADGLDLGGGGAVYIFDATTTVARSTFEDNIALGEGGGAIEANGALTLRDSELIGNRAETHDETQFTAPSDSGLGGALLIIAGSSADIDNARFAENYAGKSGGGIYNDLDTDVTLDATDVVDNTAEREFGGGIKNGGVLTLTGGEISGNTAGIHAGGIENAKGTLTVTDAVVRANSAEVGGGLFNLGDGTMELVDTIVADNEATGPVSGEVPGAGGGINNSFGVVRIQGGEIVENTAAWGGGIANSQRLELSGVRIADNTVANQQFAEGALVADGDAIRNFGTIQADDGVEIVGVVLSSGSVTGLPDDVVADL